MVIVMYFVIRIRGTTGVIGSTAETLKMLRLNRISHAVLIEDTPSFNGMLVKSKDYITWGEIDTEVLSEILSKRGEIIGGDRLTNEYLKENTDYDTIEKLADALLKSEVKLSDLGIKPVLRLHPPRKGYENIRAAFAEGGSLGYRGEAINILAKKMA